MALEGTHMKNNCNINRLSLLAILSTALAACNSSTALAPIETLPGNWLVESIQDKAVIKNSAARLRFHSDNKLSGSASCNNISSSYNSQNSALTINPIATTRKMCLPSLMEQETQLLRAINKVKRFQLNNGLLSMYDQQGVLQIKAKRLKD